MEKIYDNDDVIKAVGQSPSTSQMALCDGPKGAQKSNGAVVWFLGLLSFLLLAGIIILGIFRDIDTKMLKNLSAHLQANEKQLTSLSISLSEMTEEQRSIYKNLSAHLQANEKQLTSLNISLSKMTEEHSSIYKNLSARLQANEEQLTSLNISLSEMTEEHSSIYKNLSAHLQANEKQLISLNISLSEMTEEHSSIYKNLSARLQANEKQLTSQNLSLSEMAVELERLQRSSTCTKTCPAGWKLFRDSCYFFSTGTKSWDDSRKHCTDSEADLVVIKCFEEQEFLVNNTIGRTWIGLSDRNHEGAWTWIDGTPLTQAYWGELQPDNNGQGEDCGQLNFRNSVDKNWNDGNCGTSQKWVCEKRSTILCSFK